MARTFKGSIMIIQLVAPRVSALALLLLAACSGADRGTREPIACRLPGQAAFAEDCTIERTSSADGPILIARAPDGGFRRLLVKAGQVVAADGADPIGIVPGPKGTTDVTAAGVTYRIPAKP